jgi:TatD DNase family protein
MGRGLRGWPWKSLGMLDAHCHLDDPTLPANARGEARSAGVSGWLCAGFSPQRWAAQAALPDAWHAFGLHPWAQGSLEMLPEFLTHAVAVGEIGLDRSRGRLADQLPAFRAQLALARERDLPVILHVVRCHGKALDILRRDGVPGGMVHGFRGPAEVLPAWLELGFYVSLGESSPPFPQIPAERLLLETDAPGGGSLDGLPLTLARVAAARGASPGELERTVDANLRRLIGK